MTLGTTAGTPQVTETCCQEHLKKNLSQLWTNILFLKLLIKSETCITRPPYVGKTFSILDPAHTIFQCINIKEAPQHVMEITRIEQTT